MQPAPLRPNFKKIFILNFLKVTIGLIGLIMSLLFFNSVAGLNIITIVFEEVGGVEVNPTSLIFYLIGAFLLGYFAILILNFIQLTNIRYEFLPDKLVCYITAFFILISSKEIPYKNIVRISFESGGFINHLLNTGNVTLELSAMKEKTIKIECIDNPEEVAKFIQNMIRQYNTRDYAKSIADYRLGDIMERGGL